ncbi:snRNA-activating protein complex subunit 1b [Platichthys flesus]|uniref:snRNA-activating protein complex subunit 1b n=1 Tax=Platichthys flesus TaxID=8260 RepID=UPI001A7FE35E|nr:snRNA-activating protein complex subunit 1b [Platichthys flesus]
MKRSKRGVTDPYRKQFKSDCESLLGRFQKTESVRFQVFSQIWRESNFSHIFYGAVKHEKRAFSRRALDLAYSYFLPPLTFQIRVGGLYLLYSLYQTQTASPPEQIRVALKDWDEVMKFEKDAADAQHLDAVYILRQLMFLKAFHFTAMPTLLAYRKKRRTEKSGLSEEFVERASRPQELINGDLLEELSNIHELYENMKTSVSLPSETSVNMIHRSFVPQLRGSVLDFHKWQQNKDATNQDEDCGEGTSSQQECSNRAGLIASIKSKAYGEAAEASKSRRHRQVEVDPTSNESGPSNAPGRCRKTKPSFKARTKEKFLFSGDLLKASSSTTMISHLTSLDPVAAEKVKQFKRFPSK